MAFGKRGVVGEKSCATRNPGAAAAASDSPEIEIDAEAAAAISAWPGEDGGAASAPSAASANLTIALVVRAVIIFAVLSILIGRAMAGHGIHQWLALGLFAMVADYGRVLRKAFRRHAE